MQSVIKNLINNIFSLFKNILIKNINYTITLLLLLENLPINFYKTNHFFYLKLSISLKNNLALRNNIITKYIK